MRKSMTKSINYDKVIGVRFNVLLVVLVIFFFVLFFKLFSVMVVNYDENVDTLASLTSNKVTLGSSPRGRIYDRNYNIIVDNKALNTIVYKKEKGVTNDEMLQLAYKVAPHLELDFDKLTDRAKREFN